LISAWSESNALLLQVELIVNTLVWNKEVALHQAYSWLLADVKTILVCNMSTEANALTSTLGEAYTTAPTHLLLTINTGQGNKYAIHRLL